MANFRLDYSQKQVMQISNDAFYYLYYGEEPLDDDNLEEANEISKMFSSNFYIEDNWEAVENEGLIEATFIPYVKDDWVYEEELEVFGGWTLQIHWIDSNNVKIRFYNPTKEPFGEEICSVQINDFGRPQVLTERGGLYPLWKAKKIAV